MGNIKLELFCSIHQPSTQYRVPGLPKIRNPESGIRNPESGIRNPESGNRKLESGIQIPGFR